MDGDNVVTPCAGVWIEIYLMGKSTLTNSVTPCAGVWIEICFMRGASALFTSLPVRECGLKLQGDA